MGPVPNHSFKSAAKIPTGFPIAFQLKRGGKVKIYHFEICFLQYACGLEQEPWFLWGVCGDLWNNLILLHSKPNV